MEFILRELTFAILPNIREPAKVSSFKVTHMEGPSTIKNLHAGIRIFPVFEIPKLYHCLQDRVDAY